MFTANIHVDVEADSKKDLLKLFSFEDKNFTNNRASYVVSDEDKGIILVVNASDGVAFRAVMNSVTKVLGTYDKVKKIVKGVENE